MLKESRWPAHIVKDLRVNKAHLAKETTIEILFNQRCIVEYLVTVKINVILQDHCFRERAGAGQLEYQLGCKPHPANDWHGTKHSCRNQGPDLFQQLDFGRDGNPEKFCKAVNQCNNRLWSARRLQPAGCKINGALDHFACRSNARASFATNNIAGKIGRNGCQSRRPACGGRKDSLVKG